MELGRDLRRLCRRLAGCRLRRRARSKRRCGSRARACLDGVGPGGSAYSGPSTAAVTAGDGEDWLSVVAAPKLALAATPGIWDATVRVVVFDAATAVVQAEAEGAFLIDQTPAAADFIAITRAADGMVTLDLAMCDEGGSGIAAVSVVADGAEVAAVDGHYYGAPADCDPYSPRSQYAAISVMTWNKALNHVAKQPSFAGFEAQGNEYSIWHDPNCGDADACAENSFFGADEVRFNWIAAMSSSVILHESAHLLHFEAGAKRGGTFIQRQFKEGIAQAVVCAWGGEEWCNDRWADPSWRVSGDPHHAGAGAEVALGAAEELQPTLVDSALPFEDDEDGLRGGRWGSFSLSTALRILRDVEVRDDDLTLWRWYSWIRSNWPQDARLRSAFRTTAMAWMAHRFQRNGVTVADAPLISLGPVTFGTYLPFHRAESIIALASDRTGIDTTRTLVDGMGWTALHQTTFDMYIRFEAYASDGSVWFPCGTTTATATQPGSGMSLVTSTFELNQATRGFVEDCLLRSPRKDRVRLALQASLYLPGGELVGTSAKSANLHVGQMFPFTVWNDRSAWLDELAERVALAMLGTPFISALLEYWLNSTELIARWAAGGAFLDWFLSVHFAFFSWLGCGASGSGSLGTGLLIVLLAKVLRKRAARA